MSGGSGGGGKGGRTNGGGSGDAGQPGEVVREANEFQESLKPKTRVLVADGKVQPGTKAYETVHAENARKIQRAEYQRKLDFEMYGKAGKFGSIDRLARQITAKK